MLCRVFSGLGLGSAHAPSHPRGPGTARPCSEEPRRPGSPRSGLTEGASPGQQRTQEHLTQKRQQPQEQTWGPHACGCAGSQNQNEALGRVRTDGGRRGRRRPGGVASACVWGRRRHGLSDGLGRQGHELGPASVQSRVCEAGWGRPGVHVQLALCLQQGSVLTPHRWRQFGLEQGRIETLRRAGPETLEPAWHMSNERWAISPSPRRPCGPGPRPPLGTAGTAQLHCRGTGPEWDESTGQSLERAGTPPHTLRMSGGGRSGGGKGGRGNQGAQQDPGRTLKSVWVQTQHVHTDQGREVVGKRQVQTREVGNMAGDPVPPAQARGPAPGGRPTAAQRRPRAPPLDTAGRGQPGRGAGLRPGGRPQADGGRPEPSEAGPADH